MSLGVTLCFYLVIGAAVAVALWLSDASMLGNVRLFQAVTGLLFWPLYLPMLLTPDGSKLRSNEVLTREVPEQRSPDDEMAVSITQVEMELDAALSSLNGWAEVALESEADQFAELRAAWRQQAERVRELDRLLSASASTVSPPEAIATEAADGVIDPSSANRITESERARHDNLAKLKLVRQRCHDDLLATLAKVRQLVTMIHLAHYTGEPASRAAELVQQIAKAIEGLSKGNVCPTLA